MNTKTVKLLGYVATGLGLFATLLADAVQKKEIQNSIQEEVAKAISSLGK